MIEAALFKRDKVWEGRIRGLEDQVKILVAQQAKLGGGKKPKLAGGSNKPQKVCFCCQGTTNVHKHRGVHKKIETPPLNRVFASHPDSALTAP